MNKFEFFSRSLISLILCVRFYICRDTRSSEEIKVASRVYLVKKVKGMTLFSEESEDYLINGLYFVIDPILHQLIVLKYDYKPFW